jgi:hypothetical protein
VEPEDQGLIYYDDADEEPDPALLWDVPCSEVKNEIRNWVKEISTGKTGS